MLDDDHSGSAGTDIRAVARVGQILALFGPHTEELTAAQVGARVGLNRTTAYRYCASMVAAGLLDRGTRRGAFTVGGVVIEAGARSIGRSRVVELAGPHLRRLREATRMTAVLSIRAAVWPVVVIVEEDTSRSFVVTVRPGSRLDATAAQTHLFLAHSDAAAFEAVASSMSVAARRQLEADVEAARRRGYAVAQHSGGILAATAPVFDQRDMVATVAALGVADAVSIAPALEHVRAAAAVLTRELRGDRGSLRLLGGPVAAARRR